MVLLRAAGVGPVPFPTAVVRGLSTLRIESSRSLFTIRLACEAENMLKSPLVDAGGDDAVGDRRR